MSTSLTVMHMRDHYRGVRDCVRRICKTYHITTHPSPPTTTAHHGPFGRCVGRLVPIVRRMVVPIVRAETASSHISHLSIIPSEPTHRPRLTVAWRLVPLTCSGSARRRVTLAGSPREGSVRMGTARSTSAVPIVSLPCGAESGATPRRFIAPPPDGWRPPFASSTAARGKTRGWLVVPAQRLDVRYRAWSV